MNYIDKEFIQTILKREDIDELMPVLIRMYAEQSVSNCVSILNAATDTSKIMLRLIEKDNLKWQQATFMSILSHRMDECEPAQKFAIMTPVVIQMFPDGRPGSAKIEEDYFNEYLKLLRNKKAFDIEKESDRKWAETYGYLDYIKKMLNRRRK